MGVNCCSENTYRNDYDTEATFTRRSNLKKSAGTPSPFDKNPLSIGAAPLELNHSYDEEFDKNFELLDLPIHGRSDPTKIRRNTRVIKRGKKIRK